MRLEVEDDERKVLFCSKEYFKFYRLGFIGKILNIFSILIKLYTFFCIKKNVFSYFTCDIGSENDYSKLKAHPLFEGINWENLHSQQAPPLEVLSPHKRKKSSHSDEELFLKKKLSASELYDKVENAPVEQLKKSSTYIILSGVVLKKCGWFFYKPRQLILNNKPQLLYYDPDTNIKKVRRRYRKCVLYDYVIWLDKGGMLTQNRKIQRTISNQLLQFVNMEFN